MNKELISIIITTYNRSKYLEETLLSIQNQTYQNIEIIVVDDGSNEMIANEVKAICDKFLKCSYYWKTNTGQPDSRNFGIKRAKGNYIGFCDDDDFWVLDKLEKQIKILKENIDFDVVTGDICCINKNNQILNERKSHYPYNHGDIFKNLLVKNRTASIVPLLRKSVFEQTGLFNPSFTLAEDWDFWRKASYNHKFYAINEVLAYVRIHDNNMTYKQIKLSDRILLYQKLTKSLLSWGKEKFSKENIILIRSVEKKMYYKLISNNKNNKIEQSKFLIYFLFQHPIQGFYLFKSLFFKFIL